MKKENIVAVIGGGGREAALIDGYARGSADRFLAIPGNDSMSLLTDKPVQTFPGIETTNKAVIRDICQQEGVILADVCQDNAVEVGVADDLRTANIAVIGPSRQAGRLEWDKAWARDFADRHEIPQPEFRAFRSTTKAIDYLAGQSSDQSWFVKASGLAAGKGALPAHNRDQAIELVKRLKENLGDAANVFLIEKWLKNDDGTPGEEFSIFVVTDGTGNYQVLGSAQDNKRVFDNDQGPNTGGMGCSTPPLVLTPELMTKVDQHIIKPTIAGLSAEGIPYQGILYIGGMAIRQNGQLNPYLIEYNSRWGDPEAQVVIPGIKTDLFEIGVTVAEGDISHLQIRTDGLSRIVVTGASRGYPGDYSGVKGKEILGFDEARRVKGTKLYGAGVRVENDHYYAVGGRLFYIVGEGKDVIEAREKAYESMSKVLIEGDNLHYRTDIGIRDVNRLQPR